MAYKIKICKSLYAALVLNLFLIQLSQATVFPMKRLTCTINPVPPNNILLREFWIKIKSNWKNKTFPNNILKGLWLEIIHFIFCHRGDTNLICAHTSTTHSVLEATASSWSMTVFKTRPGTMNFLSFWWFFL